ncbi:unnamed protein product [Macrosiphum euphorbiae]|uniref:Uncharacterized protein n=1 Tax=Macrosiphum euphorbiae TaxID=13131 RepID=A0AAV0WVS2_9HEMI|nr:unnamed protein product [Macrosiphum euphorbiae]
MDDFNLEPTSKMEVETAVAKNAILATATLSISVTSMWRLKNEWQVAKVRVPRSNKPTEVSYFRVDWTSCRFRIRHPDATKCFKFGYAQGNCSTPDLKDACRKYGEKSHKGME